MRRSSSVLGRLALCVVVVAAVAGCRAAAGTPRTIAETVKRALASGYFQAEGTESGYTDATANSKTVHTTFSGNTKVKGDDDASTLAFTTNGVTFTVDFVNLGSWSYERVNGGDWTKSARAHSIYMSKLVTAGLVLEDKGVETKFSRQVHRVESTNLSRAMYETAGADLSNLGNYTVTLIFWTQDDGTLVGTTQLVSYDDTVEGVTSHVESVHDVVFEKYGGVTIEAPI
jgi:hypothetical protein